MCCHSAGHCCYLYMHSNACAVTLLVHWFAAAESPVATFAWSAISASLFQNEGGTPNCKVACNNFRLAPIVNLPTNTSLPKIYLCRFDYTSTGGIRSTVYGSVRDPSPSTPGEPACYARTVDGVRKVAASIGYECGCCGTINQVGRSYSTGCNISTAYVPNRQACPAGTAWTAPPGQQICRSRSAANGAAKVFGLITPQNATGACRVPFGATRAGWERLCYRIQPYSGPSNGC